MDKNPTTEKLVEAVRDVQAGRTVNDRFVLAMLVDIGETASAQLQYLLDTQPTANQGMRMQDQERPLSQTIKALTVCTLVRRDPENSLESLEPGYAFVQVKNCDENVPRAGNGPWYEITIALGGAKPRLGRSQKDNENYLKQKDTHLFRFDISMEKGKEACLAGAPFSWSEMPENLLVEIRKQVNVLSKKK